MLALYTFICNMIDGPMASLASAARLQLQAMSRADVQRLRQSVVDFLAIIDRHLEQINGR